MSTKEKQAVKSCGCETPIEVIEESNRGMTKEGIPYIVLGPNILLEEIRVEAQTESGLILATLPGEYMIPDDPKRLKERVKGGSELDYVVVGIGTECTIKPLRLGQYVQLAPGQLEGMYIDGKLYIHTDQYRIRGIFTNKRPSRRVKLKQDESI